MENLFEQFLREKFFLNNVSPKTIKYFQWVFLRFKKMTGFCEELPTKQILNTWVVSLRETGIQITTINSYIRGMNSFLTWLHENEHLKEKLRIKLMKEPHKTLKVFNDQQLRKLLSYRPKGFYEHRLYTLLCLIIDTG